MYRHLLYVCLLILFSNQLVFAHSGGTDANGCHVGHCHPKDDSSSSNTTKPTNTNPSSNATSTTPKPSLLNCNILKSCGEISSCDEAFFQLQVCNNDSLDKDSDNIPCEEICITQTSDNENQSSDTEENNGEQVSLNVSLPDFNSAFANGVNIARTQCKNSPEACGIKVNDYIQKGRQECIDNPKNCGTNVKIELINQEESIQESNIEIVQADFFEKGKQQCINDPQSCGISIGNIKQNPDIEAIRKQYAKLGKQSCIDNPDSCGLTTPKASPICDISSYIPVLNDQLEFNIPILYYLPLPESTIPIELWVNAILQKPSKFTNGKFWLLINESGFVPK
ncbi:hypothetical protein [Candidatus Albibeggiatoa sp. nov. BB20]|uniref:hypothetical protein n=1 Tax=Candidatus Albibeggiatoa sp. nov. BB20 TaxID=3162723 RepID=UPI00336578A4